jgi:hypothetical protein
MIIFNQKSVFYLYIILFKLFFSIEFLSDPFFLKYTLFREIGVLSCLLLYYYYFLGRLPTRDRSFCSWRHGDLVVSFSLLATFLSRLDCSFPLLVAWGERCRRFGRIISFFLLRRRIFSEGYGVI